MLVIAASPVTVECPTQREGDEEQNALDDGEDPTGLEHSTRTVDGSTPAVTARPAIVTNTNTDRNAQLGAVGIANTTIHNDTSDPSTDETNVDDRDDGPGNATI